MEERSCEMTVCRNKSKRMQGSRDCSCQVLILGHRNQRKARHQREGRLKRKRRRKRRRKEGRRSSLEKRERYKGRCREAGRAVENVRGRKSSEVARLEGRGGRRESGH